MNICDTIVASDETHIEYSSRRDTGGYRGIQWIKWIRRDTGDTVGYRRIQGDKRGYRGYSGIQGDTVG